MLTGLWFPCCCLPFSCFLSLSRMAYASGYAHFAWHKLGRHKCSAFLSLIHALPMQYDASAVIKLRSRDFTLVETPLQLQSMLRDLAQVESLAIDCEGVNLGQPQVRADEGRRGRGPGAAVGRCSAP